MITKEAYQGSAEKLIQVRQRQLDNQHRHLTALQSTEKPNLESIESQRKAIQGTQWAIEAIAEVSKTDFAKNGNEVSLAGNIDGHAVVLKGNLVTDEFSGSRGETELDKKGAQDIWKEYGPHVIAIHNWASDEVRFSVKK